MQALVLSNIGQLELCEVAPQRVGTHDVKVRVRAVGICGTDFHIFSGQANYNKDKRGKPIPLQEQPQILGHEIVGVVEEVGHLVQDLRVGDRVVLDQGLNCVSTHQPLCEYCASGDSHQCQFYREHGITGLPGGFAEYVTLPAVNAIRINSDLDLVEAALTEPVGCVAHASDMVARSRSRYVINADDSARRVRSILIFGAGPAGLIFTQYLRNVLEYDGLLLVVEPNPRKRELVSRFGAETIDFQAFDLLEVVREKTNGRLVEYLIDACGEGAAFASISKLIRKQSTVLLYGYGHAGTDLSVLNNLQFIEARLVFATGASGGFNTDGRPLTYSKAINLIETKQIEVASWITHRYQSLEAVSQAFTNDHQTHNYVKGVLAL
jgi:threonine dehydrogenase-like Zn-dependent dehydrogenase